MQLAGVVFQACSFNHSDISPFRINNLRTRIEAKVICARIVPYPCRRLPHILTGYGALASDFAQAAHRPAPMYSIFDGSMASS